MADASDLKPRTRIRLLGPLEILLSGEPVPPGGPRQRALLALLALSVGVAVPPSRLVDVLWGEEPPPSAANTVQVYVSRIRRLLGGRGEASPLRTVSGMYLLDLPPEAIDARRFELLSESGRSRLALGDPAGAARELRLALGLWRGTPLPDLSSTVGADAVITRLESLRLATLADRIDADALLGRHAALIPELEGLVLRHPLDERFVAQLMTAFYRDGRQAEAFAAYTAAADRLADELGVDPGPALRDLHARLLRQDISLTARTFGYLQTRPSSGALLPDLESCSSRRLARAGPAGYGTQVGYEQRGLSGRPGLPGQPGPGSFGNQPGQGFPFGQAGSGFAIPAARSGPIGLPAASTQLNPTSLVGRGTEFAAALAQLRHPQLRLLTLLGPAGAGKTRLAVEVAAARASDLEAEPVRIVFVPLSSVRSAAQIPAEICRVLAVEPDWSGEPMIDVAARALEQRACLLVLDHLEQLADRDLDVIPELIARTAGLSILATSRTVLRLPGERILALGPLPLPWAGADGRDVDSVLAADAVRLFRDRARAVLPSFEVTAANAGAVAALCRSLDGLPLALELVAARVRILPPDEILLRIERRTEALGSGGTRLPERQRSLWAALDWSAQLLEPAERRILAQLSVFVGGWSLEAAERVCALAGPRDSADSADSADSLEQVIDVVSRLADRSLLVADGSGRLRMHEAVQDHARALLGVDPEVARATRDRHAAYYTALAEDLGPQSRGWAGPAGLTARFRLDRETGNLTQALEHAAERNEELLGRLVTGLLNHWFCAGRLRDAERWVPAARRARLTPALRARMLESFGNLAIGSGDPVAAQEALAEAQRCAGGAAQRVQVARARAVATRALGRSDRALALVEEALAQLEAEPVAGGPDPIGLRCSLDNQRGELLDDLGRTGEAVQLWQECRRWGTGRGNPGQLAYPLANLALHALENDDWAQAQNLTQEALDAATAGQSPPLLAEVLAAAGLVDHRTGRQGRGLARLREGIRMAHECGQLISLPAMAAMLGVAQAREDPVVAVRLLAAARAWQQSRAITPVGRHLRAVVERTEADLEARAPLPAELLEAEQDRGRRTPFGSMRGLVRLDSRLRSAAEPVDQRDGTVIDLRR